MHKLRDLRGSVLGQCTPEFAGNTHAANSTAEFAEVEENDRTVATGIEIFGLVGSINATLDVIACVVDVIGTAQNQEKDEKDLWMRFRTHSAALRALAAKHQDNKSLASRILSDEDEKLMDDMLAHLEILRSTLAKRIAKLHSPPGSDSTLTSAVTSTRPVSSRISWALWRRRDLQRLEASLRDWIRQANVVYPALGVTGWHPKVVSGMAVATVDISGRNTVDRVSLKVDDYGALAGRKVNEEALLKPMQRIRVYGRERGEETPEPVVVEYTAQSYNENGFEAIGYIESATCDLAKMLSCSDPDRTGILRCMGYTHNKTLRSFGLLYELPPSARSSVAINASSTGADSTITTWRLQSLRDLYKHRPSFSLTERVTLCCDVAKAVLYVHLLGWVHKSVRPDNILFFPSPGISDAAVEPNSATKRPTQENLSQCYLAGFEYARSARAASDRRGTGDWRHNVYRHPRRQGIVSNSEYTMAHDIYSLGVVCLEIGMWGRDPACPVPYGDRSRFKTLSPDSVTAELVRILDGRSTTGGGGGGGGLVAFMGDRFASVVRFCLTIGARDDVPSARYIQEVWLKLDELRCVL